MFILDGRQAFYQWDLEQKIASEKFKVGDEVHFSNAELPNALPLITYELNGQVVVDVPNILLQRDIPITVYRYIKTADDSHTIEQQDFYVVPRTKPNDYIYTETEYHTVEKAVEQALTAAKESGDFKGDKGDKGDAGVVKFIPVAELPTENIDESAIYLVPSNVAQNNNTFDEYVYIDEHWEKISSASVEVNLDEYVKNTDYATTSKAGLVQVNTTKGIGRASTVPLLEIQKATNDEIKDKINSFKPIVPSNLDYAVKKALSDCKLSGDNVWTDEEKASARERIGALSICTTPNTHWEILYGVDKNGSQKMFPAGTGQGANKVAITDAYGCLYVADPTQPKHTVNKKYVDDALGDIETALDNIIAIQESLIGGDAE